MAKEKGSFLFYHDWIDYLNMIPDKKLAFDVLKALVNFDRDEKAAEFNDPAANMAFSFMKKQIERDTRKYEEKCKHNRENGSKGGRPAKQENHSVNLETERFSEKATETEQLFSKPKKADNDPDLDPEPDNEHDNILPLKAPSGGASGGEAESNVNKTSPFERFWEAYPRKEKKPDAQRAFDRLNPSPVLVEQMLAAIQWQSEGHQWQRDGGRYIPLPGNWITGERWRDKPPKRSPKSEPSYDLDAYERESIDYIMNSV